MSCVSLGGSVYAEDQSAAETARLNRQGTKTTTVIVTEKIPGADCVCVADGAKDYTFTTMDNET